MLDRRRPAALLATLAGALTLAVLPPVAAGAADGPAPAPTTRTVIADVHTDAVATSWEDGRLELGTWADTPAVGTRYDPDRVWFHVDDDSRTTLPAGREFVGPSGSTAWLAPESQQPGQIWMGISTEAVPAGTLDGDATTLTLTGVDGPGDVELWQAGAAGAVQRLWSSDEAEHRSFTRPRTHLHATWAFTEAGLYHLAVRADATVDGKPVSATQTYSVVVGELPEAMLTTTTLSASATEVAAGDPVVLSAEVGPAGEVAGAVEFRDGTTVLGHDPVDGSGRAELAVPDLAVGRHAVTATFVPTTTNLATTSASQPVTVTVTDASGQPFAVTGVQETYAPGDTLRARVTGVEPAEGQTLRWLMRPVDTSVTGTNLQSTTSTELTRALSIADDSYELSVALRQGTSTVLSQTPWVPVRVASDVEPQTLTRTSPDLVYVGDRWTAEIGGRTLGTGETARVVRRSPGSGLWTPTTDTTVEGALVSAPTTTAISHLWAVQVVRDGVAVAQSAAITQTSARRETQIAGLRGVYRAGQAMQLTGTVFPQREGLTYRWAVQTAGGTITRTVDLPSGTDPIAFEHTPTMADRYVQLYAYAPDGSGGQVTAGYASGDITITDTPVGEQILAFNALAEHYHQGDAVSLRLAADPELAADDRIVWEWRWPGADWTPLPGASGLTHPVVAEQALHGVEVRATLEPAAEGAEPVVADPVTIHVDDHGGAARQKPAVGGATSYTAGESLALGLTLPANGATVLTDHRWERRAVGAEEWTVVAGQSGRELALPATVADDGASYRASILKPTGELAYGPSAPVTVSVAAETATELAIAGVASSYDVGEVLRARVVGHALAEGQSWRWIIRPVGAGSGYVLSGDGSSTEVAQGRLRQLLDASYDGYEIRARLRQGSAYVAGKDTPWVPLVVQDAVEPVVSAFPAGRHFLGDDVVFPLDGPELADGDTVRLVYRSGSPWFELAGSAREGDTLVARPPYGTGASEFAVQTVRDGVVVAVSAPMTGEIAEREVLVSGLRGVYRVGQTLSVTAEVYPPAAGLIYRWYTLDGWDQVVLQEGTGPEALTFERPDLAMDWDEKPLYFAAVADARVDDPVYGDEIWTGQWSTTVQVSDAAPDTQLLFFEGLSGHYHQGYDIDLQLIADPALAPGDTIAWEWRWPGGDWAPVPGASGLAHHLVAEQALAGVEVRATLHAAGAEPLVAEPVTIHHDDHGGAPRQQPTITGVTSVTEGDTVTLTRALPENGATVLTGHRWERRAAGSDAWTAVEGASAAELSFPAATDDDGASYRVSIVKPTGEVAYGPSPEVTLAVADRPAPEPATTTVTAATVRQVYGQPARLTVRVAPAATGTVEVRVGGSTLTGRLAAGSATVTLPRRALAPGLRTIALGYAGAEGAFRSATGTARVRVVKATPSVRVRAVSPSVARGGQARVRVVVGAEGVTPGGTVVVRIAGVRKVATLDGRGRALVRVPVRRTTTPGAARVVVAYRGDRFVAAVPRSTTTLRVTR